MRFQQGVEDSPTREPISATESAAFSCRTARILRSMASTGPSEVLISNHLAEILFKEKNIPNQDAGAKAALSAKKASTSVRFGAPVEPPIRVHLSPATAEPKRMAATSF